MCLRNRSCLDTYELLNKWRALPNWLRHWVTASQRRRARRAVTQTEARAKVGYPTLHRLSVFWLATAARNSSLKLITIPFSLMEASRLCSFANRIIAYRASDSELYLLETHRTPRSWEQWLCQCSRGKKSMKVHFFSLCLAEMPHAYSPGCLNKVHETPTERKEVKWK